MTISKPITDIRIFESYNFELSEIIDWVKDNQITFLALQVPEGLKRQLLSLNQAIVSELEIELLFIGDPCFGACDLVSQKLMNLGVDGIIQFGHSEIPSCMEENCKIPTKFMELHSRIDPSNMINESENLDFLRSEFNPNAHIGILATVQFISYLDSVKSALASMGFSVTIGTGNNRLAYPGQVLGCNFSAAGNIARSVDGFIFIGDGEFHPLGISLATGKTVVAFDPITNKMQNMNKLKDHIMRQRSGALARAKECFQFGIIISTKPGQTRKDYAISLKEKLSQNKKQGTLLAFDNISPAKLDYLPFDAFVNTACPRLTIDDYLQYKKVIITPIELEIILGERTWEQYQLDEII